MAGAALMVMVFFILSRATGLLREMVIGAQFGTSAQLDAYLAAFRLPDLIFQLVAGGALGSAFIPTFSGYWVKGDYQGAWLLFSRILNWITLILVALAALAALFAMPLVKHLIAPGFAPAQQALTADLMRWMLLGSIVFGASGLVMGALNAVQHFLLPAAAPVLYSLAILLGAWWLGPRYGVYGLAAGVVTGSAIHLLIQLPALWRRRAQYHLDITLTDPGVRQVFRLMGPRVLGLLFVQLHFLVNTILASGLDTGSLSALNYGWLLMLLPLGVFAQALATVAFPTFAAQVAAGEAEAMAATFGQILRLVLFLTIPAAAVLLALREPLIRALLQRGRFGDESTHMVAYALQFYALGLVAHAVVEIAVRGFYALHDTRTPVAIGIGAMALNIGLSFWWVGPLGYGGLALANTAATTLEMFGLLWLLDRRMGGLDRRRLAQTLARCTAAALAAALAGWAWTHWLETAELDIPPNAAAWVAAGSGLAVMSVVYLGANLLLRSEELAPLGQLASKRRRSI
jgi:putative peptidoglycan lipid II flippase